MDNEAVNLGQLAAGQPEMRSRDPSWREQLASFLVGEERPSVPKRDFISGLLGSTGAGRSGTGLVDMGAPGAMLDMQEHLQGGNKGQALVDAFLSMIMPGGVGQAVKRAPAAAKALGGGAAALATPTAMGSDQLEAAPRLTREQQQALEVQRQQAEIAARAKGSEAKDKSEAETAALKARLEAEGASEERRTRLGLEAAQKQRESEAQFKEESRRKEAARLANEAKEQTRKPFAEKYGPLAEALPAVGLAGAAALPYGSKLESVASRNAVVRQWLEAMKKGEAALPSGVDPALRTRAQTTLSGLAQTPQPPAAGAGKAATGISSLLPAEGVLMPAEYNAAMLPPDSPDRARAQELLSSPSELAGRLLPSAIGGASMAGIGAKAPSFIPQKAFPLAADIKGLAAGLSPPVAQLKQQAAALSPEEIKALIKSLKPPPKPRAPRASPPKKAAKESQTP